MVTARGARGRSKDHSHQPRVEAPGSYTASLRLKGRGRPYLQCLAARASKRQITHTCTARAAWGTVVKTTTTKQNHQLLASAAGSSGMEYLPAKENPSRPSATDMYSLLRASLPLASNRLISISSGEIISSLNGSHNTIIIVGYM